MLRFTCSFKRFVDTPYKVAKSPSSITWTPRTVRILDLISISALGINRNTLSFIIQHSMLLDPRQLLFPIGADEDELLRLFLRLLLRRNFLFLVPQ